MNVQPCARCGYGVYPAEKINCIDQTWHKACFHCEVCKMMLTVNNFVSHEKKPYCQVHNPKNNAFTSVFETPININAKKLSEVVSEIKYREQGEQFRSAFQWDMRSTDIEAAYKAQQLASQNAYYAAYEGGTSWYSGSIPDPQMVRVTQAQKTMNDFQYTEEYEPRRGKGSFPAMITPGYQVAKRATQLSSNVEYKRGHEERVSKFTSVVDTPDILHAKVAGQLSSDLKYTEDFEERRGKGSFPAMITPAYQIAKRANELASDVKYHQQYENEIKGKASHTAGTDVNLARENVDQYSQDYMDEYEERRGKGSFPAMITPAYQNAKKANELASDIKYKKDLSKMKGAAHFHSLTAEDNLVLKQAQSANKLVSEVEYKKGLGNNSGYSINYCDTPQFKSVSKISKYTSDLKYRETYQNQVKGHYIGIGMDKRMLHAMKVGNLASNIAYKSDYKHDGVDYNYPATLTPSYQTTRKLVPLKDVNYRQSIDKLKYSSVASTPQIAQAKINAQQLSDLNYRAQYEKTKTNYTLPQDVPQLVKAKANAELYSEVKYKEGWEKSKGQGFEMKLDSLPLLAAKASRDLASDIKYKEEYEKTKGKAIGTKDSRLLHSLQVAKMSSEIAYKKDFEESKTHFHLPMDMVNLRHAKKAQALASDLDYRKRLHEYTVVPEDMKTKWAKKAYGLQSDLQYRSDLMWMKGVGCITEGSLNIQHAKNVGDLVSEKKYRQKVDALKFTSVADSSQIKHAKKSQELQSDVAYRSGKEQFLHQYTITKDDPFFILAKANAANISEKLYRSSWEKQKKEGFVLRLDALSFLTAKAKRDLASDIKYKEDYEKMKGKLIGVKAAEEDSKMAHSLQMSKLQSDLEYKRAFEDTKNKFHVSMDMVNLVHAKKAQNLATDKGYKTALHHYTALPTDMKVAWAKWAYGLQSDNRYRADLNWMKGAGWIATGSLNVEQAKKAGELISERLYKEHGESVKHQYTPITDFPELLLAKLNSMNISEIRYKETWGKMKDGGYQMKLDAIPFQAAKASGEIISDHKYKEAFEKMKGQMVGSCGLDGDIHIAHSVHASSLQSDVKYKQGFEDTKAHFHLPLDMINLVHARKAQSLVSEQEYRQLLHQYTSLTDDLRLQCAKNAYKLQSENLYRSDMNFMRGVGCITPGALEIEGKKKASELISESKYRQQPHSFKYTSVTDSPGLLHAKFSNMIANERLYKAAGEDSQHHYTPTLGLPEFTRARINAANLSDAKYRESWHNLRAQGYKLTTEALPFQTARASREIASDYQYKYNFVMERGKHIGARSVLDDTRLLHCLHAAKLQSEQEYKKGSQGVWSQYHLPMDMVNLVHARKAQALASDQDYRKRLHEFTALPEDMKMKWAKKAHMLQSEHRYKSDLNFMKGVGWMALRSPQIESVKKAGELISETKYRQKPESLKFTSVVDSPDLIHAKNSYLQCSDRLYKAGDSEAMHKYTLPPDHPDFIRARQNALHISDKVYKTSWEQTRASGYDFRIDAIPFQTAKASREIASDYKYRETFLRGRGQQIGFLSANDDPKIRHVLRVGKLQSDNQYRSGYAQNRAQFHSHLNQPGFLHAKRSQQLASNVNYKQPLHEYTCDPEQLNVKHAKQAYKLQSDVKYKSDLNWLRGIGWTPPGSYKVEMARRAAELAYLRDMAMQAASAQYGPQADQLGAEGSQQVTVNPDASEILQVKRRKMQLYK
ncbi:nebulin-related-anchoring protein isoform X2 [Anas platyrhynchos]|uniref:nebulin-related-anchoring protein isoform X2 n=1 Tax=Anas platyrhynchos TaxID=8839 RepID=UPI00065DC0A2|nr:nebulin-related-anchoring protein isoform X2 [Anas platyrhynchos]|eukprot:XP_012950143.1 nebulin-related-anchoring protein isoform X2 [Anas platyrhynchos]